MSVAAVAEKVEEKETMLESIAGLCVVIAIWVFATTFVVQNFVIPSGSMEKTLLIGDHVVVDRNAFAPAAGWMPLEYHREPTRGDVIVFLKPHPEEPDLILVKRLIGMPGDRIHLRHGLLYLNGVAQNEPYAAMPADDGDMNHGYVAYRDDFPQDLPGIQEESAANHAPVWAAEIASHIEGDDIVVPPGMMFAMGDNRLGSLDSRFWGFVPRENILGRPLVVFWSFRMGADQMEKTSVGDKIGYMVHVVTHLFDGTRWSRTLHVVR